MAVNGTSEEARQAVLGGGWTGGWLHKHQSEEGGGVCIWAMSCAYGAEIAHSKILLQVRADIEDARKAARQMRKMTTILIAEYITKEHHIHENVPHCETSCYLGSHTLKIARPFQLPYQE